MNCINLEPFSKQAIVEYCSLAADFYTGLIRMVENFYNTIYVSNWALNSNIALSMDSKDYTLLPFGCYIDTTRWQMTLHFESVVSIYLSSVVLVADN